MGVNCYFLIWIDVWHVLGQRDWLNTNAEAKTAKVVHSGTVDAQGNPFLSCCAVIVRRSMS